MPDEVMTRKRLIDYLPPFMQDFAEIKAIMKTEQPELDRAWLDIQIPLADAFIMDCDEYGLKKYEAFVGVMPGPGDTLDERKARVLIWWNNFIPYTYRVLVRRLNALCGAGNYEISGSLENYELLLKTNLMLGGQMQSLEHLIIQMVPMNMNCGAENELICDADGFMGCAGGVCTIEKVVITSDFRDCWKTSGSEQARGIADYTAVLQVSNDWRDSAETIGDERTAALAVYTTENLKEPVSGEVSVKIVESS